jgi:hypothetical protein
MKPEYIGLRSLLIVQAYGSFEITSLIKTAGAETLEGSV